MTNQAISELKYDIEKFPPVVVEQTNFRISEIIKRNQAGQQVLGVKNLQFDYKSDAKNPPFDYVNPFNDIGFNLDDVIRLAERKGQEVTDLQNRFGELKQELDKSKQTDPEPPAQPTPPAAPADPAQ